MPSFIERFAYWSGEVVMIKQIIMTTLSLPTKYAGRWFWGGDGGSRELGVFTGPTSIFRRFFPEHLRYKKTEKKAATHQSA